MRLCVCPHQNSPVACGVAAAALRIKHGQQAKRFRAQQVDDSGVVGKSCGIPINAVGIVSSCFGAKDNVVEDL